MVKLLKIFRQYIIKIFLTKNERRHALVGPHKLWRMKRDFQIAFLKKNALMPEHFFLDIGCGTLRGGIPIIDYLKPGHYFGIDSREKVIEEGKKELKEKGLSKKNPTLIISENIVHSSITQKFDVIWAFSVLIHMSDDIIEDTLLFVSNHLSKNGVFFANVNIGKQKEGIWQGFPVVWRSLDFYKKTCAKHGLHICDMGTLHELGHVSNFDLQDNQRMLKIWKT